MISSLAYIFSFSQPRTFLNNTISRTPNVPHCFSNTTFLSRLICRSRNYTAYTIVNGVIYKMIIPTRCRRKCNMPLIIVRSIKVLYETSRCDDQRVLRSPPRRPREIERIFRIVPRRLFHFLSVPPCQVLGTSSFLALLSYKYLLQLCTPK